jgi:hypothetical protein
VTSPLATASSNVYAVSFDGFVVTVAGARRGKVLRQIPLAEIAAVEFKPARGVAGGSLRFRVRGKASPRDAIMFVGNQEPDMEHLARTVERYVRERRPLPAEMPQVDPWPPMEPPVRVVVGDPRMNAATARALTWAARLEMVNLLILLAPFVLVAAALGWWFLIR